MKNFISFYKIVSFSPLFYTEKAILFPKIIFQPLRYSFTGESTFKSLEKSSLEIRRPLRLLT